MGNIPKRSSQGQASWKDKLRGMPIKEEEMATKKGMRKKTREERGKIEEETFLYF